MSISGFTFIKGGLSLGYPIKESIESISPLCDEVIINVGFDDTELKVDDGTYEYLRDHFQGAKFKFIKNYWNPETIKEGGGKILAEQTNLALKECTKKYCLYIQGDELIHENDFDNIKTSVKKLDVMENKNIKVDGLIFNYIHFYGDVSIEKYTQKTYRREIRLIRNQRDIISWKDAQGFRYSHEKKIPALRCNANIYHYGWARESVLMLNKIKTMGKFYLEENNSNEVAFQYQRIWGLRPFKGTHPKVLKSWIENNQSNQKNLNLLQTPYKFKFKDLNIILSDYWDQLTGTRIGEYKNYIEISDN
jgi:hypothetical protein